MKARIRKTGEIVDVISFTSPLGTRRSSDDRVCYIDSKGSEQKIDGMNRFWDIEEVMEDETSVYKIDWEQRRYEIAKSVLPDFRDGSNVWLSAEDAAKCAVHYADALIAELKKGVER